MRLREECESTKLFKTFKLFMCLSLLFNVFLIVARTSTEGILVASQAHIACKNDVHVLNSCTEAREILRSVSSCVHIDRSKERQLVVSSHSRLDDIVDAHTELHKYHPLVCDGIALLAKVVDILDCSLKFRDYLVLERR